MHIETLFDGEMSMDNPPLITNPININEIFIFKGEPVKVTSFSKSGIGFYYEKTNSKQEGFMSFYYYVSTPSYKGKRKFSI